MGSIAIRAEGISKRYAIGAHPMRYHTLRETLMDLLRRPFQRHRMRDDSDKSPDPESIWALKDVSFEVNHGEVIGIIGRNGAGKSTLLKILSRITEPTTGEVEICGRVNSLLEVGTGFHPELTGRENVFLNAAIMGMKREQIARKFDEIVAFAEVDEHLDTPVKRYSSGMYMRLAFAIAAHLDSEILFVDEVLAVGDVSFQKRCLGKMEEVAREGRTVLFVSHNMAAIEAMCSRGILLLNGRLAREGPVKDVIEDYLLSVEKHDIPPIWLRTDRSGDGSIRVTSLEIENEEKGKTIRSTSRLKVAIGYESSVPIRYARFLVGVYDYRNVGIFLLDSEISDQVMVPLPNKGTMICHTDEIRLTPGRCYVNVAIQKGSVMADYISHATTFEVTTDDICGHGRVPSREWMLSVLNQRWAVISDEFND